MTEAPASAYDLVVVGSGAAGMAAAITARLGGLNVAIIEKSEHFGGSTAVSGGAIWIPCNPKMGEHGIEDSEDAAFTYIAGEAGNRMKADLVRAFLREGPRMVSFFEENTALQFESRAYSPDYHSDQPGAALGGRVLDAKDYDGRKLGKRFAQLRRPIEEFTLLGGMMLNRFDIGHFMKMRHSPKSAWHAAKLVARHAGDRLSHDRGTRLVLGQAVAGRLAQTVFDLGISLFTETGLRSLILRDGVVVGLRTSGAHGDRDILAKRGVVLATGGFPQNARLRAQHMAHVRDGAKHYSVSPMTGTGDAIEAARAVGAALEDTNSNAGFWAPVSLLPTKAGPKPFPHLFLDRAKPGVIAINRNGRRFVNEAFSYHDFVEGMIRAGEPSAWLICDHTTLRRYGLGAVRPFPAPIGAHVRSGYLKKADTIEALARVIGVPAEALSGTLASYNADALSGEDRAFGKGSTAYQTYLGDPENKPNPCLRPVEDGPFYAIEIFPGDIGTSVGLATDARGRVLTENGDVLAGLYACGNDMNSIMGGAYPGAGITLGPALTFGYIVGQSAAASPNGHLTGDVHATERSV